MYHFWQSGAETVENIRFGEHPASAPDRRTTTTRSAGSWIFRAFISNIGASIALVEEKVRGNG